MCSSNFLSSRLVGRTLIEATAEIRQELGRHRAELDDLTSRVVEQGLAMWAGEGPAGALIVRGQAQLLDGTAHFRVPIERGLELFKSMRGRTSGFAIPQYVLDTPHGKVPLDHAWARGRDGDDFVVEAWTGDVWREPNPQD